MNDGSQASLFSLGDTIEYAADKRNQEFHALFRSVPANDPLIEDYACALQREILIQGRIYLTRSHLAFNSNIFGYVTNLVVAYSEILAIERKTTALVIPNAVGVTTLHSRFVFGSFMSRESVYSLLMRLWRSALGEDVDGLPWSRDVFMDSVVVSSDAETDTSQKASEPTPKPDKRSLSPKKLTRGVTSLQLPTDEEVKRKASNFVASSKPVPVYCNCHDHYKNIVLDKVYPMPISKLQELVYSKKDFWEQVMKRREFVDVQVGEWSSDTRHIEYGVPLSLIIGPRSTHCVCTQKFIAKEATKVCLREVNTSPDIPFATGSSFKIQSSQCMMRVSETETRLLVTFDIEWMRPNLLRGIVDRNAVEGNEAFWLSFEGVLGEEVLKYQRSLTVEPQIAKVQSNEPSYVQQLKLQWMSDEPLTVTMKAVLVVALLVVLFNGYVLIGLRRQHINLQQTMKVETGSGKVNLDDLPKFWFIDQRDGDISDLDTLLSDFMKRDDSLQEQLQQSQHMVDQSLQDLQEDQIAKQLL